MVPEQAIHGGILRLHHQLTSTKHSSGTEECFKRKHCELRTPLPELCLRIWRDLQSDPHLKRRSSSSSQLATHHTGELCGIIELIQ